MWIMIAGPYRSGSNDPAVWRENLLLLNRVAYQVFQKGHTPVIGVNMALPVIEGGGGADYDRIMLPLSLSLAERCDGVLRVGGPSRGADDEVRLFETKGLPVYRSLDEVPAAETVAPGGDRPAGS